MTEKPSQGAFIEAVSRGDGPAVEDMVKRGADVDGVGQGSSTPLMIAVMNGNARMVQRLLDAGADTTLRDRAGNTALDIAIGRRYAGIEMMLEEITFSQESAKAANERAAAEKSAVEALHGESRKSVVERQNALRMKAPRRRPKPAGPAA